ncbi:hypothetical protein RU639_013150 [Aspergillus parasiticus]
MEKSKRNTCLPAHLWNSNNRPDVKPSGVDSLDKPSGEDANQNSHSARIHVPLHVLPTTDATDSQEHYNGPVSPQQTGCKFIQDGKPSRKYLISWKIDQAGPGWIGLENSPGYPAEVLIKLNTMGKKHYRQSNLRAATHPNIVDLLEAFYHGSTLFLAYRYHGLAVTLSLVRSSPHVYLSDVDFATICRSVLRGLQYVHDTLRISHGAISSKSVLLFHDGEVRITNIGCSMLEGVTLRERETDRDSVATLLVNLCDPRTILEEGERYLQDPANISAYGKDFIRELKTAPYSILFQHEFLQQAPPGDRSWNLKPHYLDAIRYGRVLPDRIKKDEMNLFE